MMVFFLVFIFHFLFLIFWFLFFFNFGLCFFLFNFFGFWFFFFILFLFFNLCFSFSFLIETLNEWYQTVSAKSSWFVNFHGKTTSKWLTHDPLNTRHVTYPSLPVDDFEYRPQIIYRGVGQRHFPVCSQKDSRLTLPQMKYFEVLTSFASSKTSYFIRLFGILTSDAGIFIRKYCVTYLEYHAVSCPTLVLRPSDFALKMKKTTEKKGKLLKIKNGKTKKSQKLKPKTRIGKKKTENEK